jgi:hypothetical protein
MWWWRTTLSMMSTEPGGSGCSARCAVPASRAATFRIPIATAGVLFAASARRVGSISPSGVDRVSSPFIRCSFAMGIASSMPNGRECEQPG